eukprot:Gregarina_sp_Poly_1__7777@NODE_43_length_18077_cov_117_559078_g37_i0_p7_GENE_NODE_43_length_18077_cov_117_559078_g37_i0NODE_43_length_18077_cov_117_559078_g37_i0_p7_ORF_typecomplete_len373_score63_37_NODE_43_length_18077_cov_117_559078_g37_i09412059
MSKATGSTVVIPSNFNYAIIFLPFFHACFLTQMLPASSEDLAEKQGSASAIEEFSRAPRDAHPSGDFVDAAPPSLGFWEQFFEPFSGCCASSTQTEQGDTKPMQRTDTDESEMENLRDIARNYPEISVALEILKNPANKAKALLASGRLPAGVEIAGRLEEQLRAAMLGGGTLSQDALTHDVAAGGPMKASAITRAGVQLVGDFGSDSGENVAVEDEFKTMPTAVVVPGRPQYVACPTVCLLEALLVDSIKNFESLSVSILTTTVRPILHCRGTSKLLGALWWLLELTRSTKQTGQLLCTLSRRVLMHDIIERQSRQEKLSEKDLRYRASSNFNSLTIAHEELNALVSDREMYTSRLVTLDTYPCSHRQACP